MTEEQEPLEEQAEDEPLPACAGVTKAGEPCGRKLLSFITPDGRRWCSTHTPPNGEPDKLYVGPTKVTVPCAGVLRDDSPCEKRGTWKVTIAGEEKMLCSWHHQIWEQHRVLKPPPRRRKQVVTVDSEEITPPEPPLLPLAPLSAEGEHAAASTNGNEPKTIRERVEDTTEALYEDIERGLREALTNATKARKTRCPSCQETFEVRLPDHGASISAAKSLLDLVVSRPKPELEPSPVDAESEGFDISKLSTPQLRRYLSLTEEAVVERLDEETLEEKVELVVDVAERFMADPRDVPPHEVTEAKALLASMRHYDRALAPIRKLRLNWRVPLEPDTDIPPAPRSQE